ncbi:hypothetical protein RCL_jg15315.t1 [Rhizophagus clarus]|uniref:Tc1-like transposase DDE domain-containing protein n=1 Tax=Rhizophagus clarus TaxID=94130 RepID=A0A8H3KRS8_9GLOM|nr:hypothetical protein RCL_jg15315.t1 [Rhizophagus clarus]
MSFLHHRVRHIELNPIALCGYILCNLFVLTSVIIVEIDKDKGMPTPSFNIEIEATVNKVCRTFKKWGCSDKTRFVDLLIKDKIFRYLDELVYEMEQRIGKWGAVIKKDFKPLFCHNCYPKHSVLVMDNARIHHDDLVTAKKKILVINNITV